MVAVQAGRAGQRPCRYFDLAAWQARLRRI